MTEREALKNRVNLLAHNLSAAVRVAREFKEGKISERDFNSLMRYYSRFALTHLEKDDK